MADIGRLGLGQNSYYNYDNHSFFLGGKEPNYNKIAYSLFYDEDKGVNGEIDEAVFQGETGDCWLMSGILSLSYSDEGKELIKNAISQDEYGNYQVTFDGIGKTYTITQDELESKNVSTLLDGIGIKSEYSTGDDDMLLLELAVDKAQKDESVDLPTVDGLSGGSAYHLYNLFSKNVEYANRQDPDAIEFYLKYYQKYQDTASATLGVLDGFSGLQNNHAYAIKDYDGENITLVNPWDTTNETVISDEQLMNNLGKFDVSITDEM